MSVLHPHLYASSLFFFYSTYTIGGFSAPFVYIKMRSTTPLPMIEFFIEVFEIIEKNKLKKH